MFARLVNQFWKNRAIVNRERPAQPRRVLLECERLAAREVRATLAVGPGGQCATIQAAVNAAHNSGDTINVFNSTYQEQVVLSNRFTSLTLQAAANNHPTIKAPPQDLTGSQALVDINGATGIVLSGF